MAIQGFEYIYKKNNSLKQEIHQAVDLFAGDLDETVVTASRALLEKL